MTFEIAKQFLINFLNFEISELNKNKKIRILSLEQEITCNRNIKGLSFPIHFKGKVDRIDEIDGVLRIIDYKTGKVEANNLNISNWDLLVTDEKYSKSFQVLMYAFMYGKQNNIDFDNISLESGIISFKNLKSGFMRVNYDLVTQSTIDHFLEQLDRLILDIYNVDHSFKEKEIPQFKY